MTDLLGAASRIDDAVRVVDRILASGTGGANPTDTRLITGAVSDATTQLAAAMPSGFGGELRSFYLPYDLNLPQLATARSQLGHLSAVTRAVHELGGVDHVVSQGGLDAVDGAADVIRRHLLLDANDQLRSAKAIIDDRPFGISMSRGTRSEHLGTVRRAMAAPMEQLRDSGMVDEAGDPLVTRLQAARQGTASKAEYDRVIRDAGEMVDHVRGLGPTTAPTSDSWAERMLVSNRARSIATEHAARATLPTAPRLASLADDAAVLAHADAALEQHAATYEALQVAVGSADPYDKPFRDAFIAARQKLDRASEDVTRIDQLLADAPDSMRDTAFLARDWVSAGARLANTSRDRFASGDSRLMTSTLDHIRSLQAHLATVTNEPHLLRAGTEIGEEIQEVLARPGERIDLDVMRGLLAGDVGTRARTAFVEHLPRIKPHPVDAAQTRDMQEAVKLLDEVELIGTAMDSQITKSRWVPDERYLDEPGLREATADMVARADGALGTSALVGERTASLLETQVSNLRGHLDRVDPAAGRRPGDFELGNLLAATRDYRTELAARASQFGDDGGLRAITPSARPAQAAEARTRWLVRELDALTVPAAGATSAEHIDDAARRATLTHELLHNISNVKDPDEKRALLERAMTEYQSLGPTWRMPDDVAIDVIRIRDEIQRTGSLNLDRQLNVTVSGYNTNPGMNRASSIASGLQAWAMFADGPLPETAADRLAVAARRGASVRSYLDSLADMPPYDRERIRIVDQIEELRMRIATVDEIAGDTVPASVRSGLDEVFANFEAEIARRTSLRAEYRDPGPADPSVYASSPVDAWVASLEDAHRAARASDAEQLTW